MKTTALGLTALISLFSTVTSAAPSSPSLLELRGRALELESFDVDFLEYEGRCDATAMKTYAHRNYVSYGDDAAIVFADSIACPGTPNFNVVGVQPKDANPEEELVVTLGVGAGVIAGLFAGEIPEGQKFKLQRSQNYVASCILKKHSWMEAGFGRVFCTLNNGRSSIQFFVH